MKIAIMTFYKDDNFGTVLQAAALRKFLQSAGHEADIISYLPDGKVSAIPENSARSVFMQQVKEELREAGNPPVASRISGEDFDKFRQEHLTMTSECRTLSDLERLNETYDAFVCGSERIWSAVTFDPHLFLDFVHDPERMIAYAPCILREGMSDEYRRRRIGELVKRFRHLSVREEIGRKLLNEYYEIRTEEVADPVLLLDRAEWEKYFGKDWKAAAGGTETVSWIEDALGGTAQEPRSEAVSDGEEILENTETATLLKAGTDDTPEEAETVTDETGSEAEAVTDETPGEAEAVTDDIQSETEISAAAADAAELSEKAAEGTGADEPEPYMFIYFLSGRRSFWDAAYKLAQRLGLSVRAVPAYENDLKRPGILKESVGPARFAELIHGASYVCTDCYHATLLAILFHKEMCCFNRYPVGPFSGRNIRMKQILDAVGLFDRLYDDNASLEQYLRKTDFIPVQYKLDALRLKSMSFLTRSLETISRHHTDDLPKVRHVREIYSLCCGCGACEAVCPSGAAVVSLQENGFLEASVREDLCIRCGRCTRVCPMQGEAEGVLLRESTLLSYSDEDEGIRKDSDAGGLARRLTGLLLKQGYAVAGCAFDEERVGAKHIVISPQEPDGTSGQMESERVGAAEEAAPCSSVETDALTAGPDFKEADERTAWAGSEEAGALGGGPEAEEADGPMTGLQSEDTYDPISGSEPEDADVPAAEPGFEEDDVPAAEAGSEEDDARVSGQGTEDADSLSVGRGTEDAGDLTSGTEPEAAGDLNDGGEIEDTDALTGGPGLEETDELTAGTGSEDAGDWIDGTQTGDEEKAAVFDPEASDGMLPEADTEEVRAEIAELEQLDGTAALFYSGDGELTGEEEYDLSDDVIEDVIQDMIAAPLSAGKSEREKAEEKGLSETEPEPEPVPDRQQDPYAGLTAEEKLNLLQGVKLSQSDFSAVWKHLETTEEKTLVVGAPCQIAALRKVFGERDNLCYIDFVCGGVPTQLLLEKYRHSFRGRNGISQDHFRIRYRYKNGTKGNSFILIHDESRERAVPMKKDGLSRMLELGSCCSKACYNCRWRDRSCADLRIGTADASGTGEKDAGMIRVLPAKNELPTLSSGAYGNRKEDITAVFCLSTQGRQMLNLLMTEGYWEGLHKQQAAPYLQQLRTVNHPLPVYYPELIALLRDEKASLRKVLNEYARPIEKREKALNRLQRFTLAGRKRAKQIRQQKYSAENEGTGL